VTTDPAARTQVRRLPDKAAHDRASLDAVLDAAYVAHVGIVEEAQPVVIPMAAARDGDRLLLHGSRASRLMRALAAGAPACATLTVLDGFVFARSAFESSMHYRSATVFGSAQAVSTDEIDAALRILTEHLMPGRWAELRAPTRRELAATLVVALPLCQPQSGAPSRSVRARRRGW
jgi:nitroimidazol reductase NimA-like FMN-containing flavoprotein (pyridoxamine 5'-phosphate oxidase superfamily)